VRKKQSTKKRAARRAPAKARGKKSAARAPKRAKSMSQEAMMELWQKAATPGKWHAALEPMVGSFNARTTMVMNKGGEPSVSEGTSENRWVLGGRHLEQVYRGTAMGMPFEGIGFTGFENVKKRYVGVWMDSFGTGLMYSRGVGKPTPSVMEFEAMAHESSGKVMKFLCKITIQDHDHHVYEMWTLHPQKYRSMLVEYTRK